MAEDKKKIILSKGEIITDLYDIDEGEFADHGEPDEEKEIQVVEKK